MKTSANIPKVSGIYRISIGPRTFYWGQSQNLRKRDSAHLYYLRSGAHNNRHLQASFNKHGEAAYTFEVSLLCPVEDLDMQEQFALDIYHGTPGCVNVAVCAEAPARGRKQSEEEILRRALSNTGRKRSDTQRARIGESLRRSPAAQAHRAAMFARKVGVPRSEETRKKISKAKTGVPLPAQVRDAKRARNPNILVERSDGSVEIWPSQNSLSTGLGFKNAGVVSNWLAGRQAIPAKYNIASISRTELTATINPEAL